MVHNPKARLLEGEKLEEEVDGRMRIGFHSKLFILSLYLCFSLFFGCTPSPHVLILFSRVLDVV